MGDQFMTFLQQMQKRFADFGKRRSRRNYGAPTHCQLGFETLQDRQMLIVPYGGGAVWGSTDLTFSYSNLPDNVWNPGPNDSNLIAAAEEAMGVWASVSPLTFTQTGDSGPPHTAADNLYPAVGTPQIRWGHHFLDGPPITGMVNTLAHGFRPGTNGLFFGHLAKLVSGCKIESRQLIIAEFTNLYMAAGLFH